MYNDFCPLCGSRFSGNTPEEVYDKILKHLEPDELGKSYCEMHFRPLEVALADTGGDLKDAKMVD